jgi:hypothetical protein
MTKEEYDKSYFDLWYCDYFWVWYIAKKEMYDQWPFSQKE